MDSSRLKNTRFPGEKKQLEHSFTWSIRFNALASFLTRFRYDEENFGSMKRKKMAKMERFSSKIQFQQKYLHRHLGCLTRPSLFRVNGAFLGKRNPNGSYNQTFLLHFHNR